MPPIAEMRAKAMASVPSAAVWSATNCVLRDIRNRMTPAMPPLMRDLCRPLASSTLNGTRNATNSDTMPNVQPWGVQKLGQPSTKFSGIVRSEKIEPKKIRGRTFMTEFLIEEM